MVSRLPRLETALDYHFKRRELLVQAVTHRSHGAGHNERLEFLGDSILGFSVTDTLYRDNPGLSEGELAKRRSAVVSTKALASVARRLGLGEYILLGQGEKLTNGKDKSSILADTTEALIGAVYLCHGIETARSMVMRLIGPLLHDADTLGAGTDWKTSIQEIAAARKMGDIEYRVTGSGPDHSRSFVAVLHIGGQAFGTGTGRSKKDAEQEAAADTCRLLRESSQAPAAPAGA